MALETYLCIINNMTRSDPGFFLGQDAPLKSIICVTDCRIPIYYNLKAACQLRGGAPLHSFTRSTPVLITVTVVTDIYFCKYILC